MNVSVELIHGPDMECSSVAITPLIDKLGVIGRLVKLVTVKSLLRIGLLQVAIVPGSLQV